MNLFAIKTIAIIVCDDAKRIKNKLRESGYASIEGKVGKLAVLNISRNILERMCRCRYNAMSIEGYLTTNNDNIDDALQSAEIPTEELNRVNNAIYQNAAAVAGYRGWADAESLIEWTIDHFGYVTYSLRREITKGL